MKASEEILHYLWIHRHYRKPLYDLNGSVVEVLDPGVRNRDAGPDFFNVKIRIESLVWAGTAEIHRKASDWYLHGHDGDPVYNNVILHLVMEADCQARNAAGRSVCTAVMEYDPDTMMMITELIHQPLTIACLPWLSTVDKTGWTAWLDRLGVERLEARTRWIEDLLEQEQGDWEEVCYRVLGRAFGEKANADPFEMLMRAVPLRILRKLNPDRLALEAILFGQAGFLGTPEKSAPPGPSDQPGPPAPPGSTDLANAAASPAPPGPPVQSGSAAPPGSAGPFDPAGSPGPPAPPPLPGSADPADAADATVCLGQDRPDQYLHQLRQCHHEYRRKLGSGPMDPHLWNFLRLRPANFPTIRISQMAALLRHFNYRLSVGEDLSCWTRRLTERSLAASVYWDTRYRFGNAGPLRVKTLGAARADVLMINAILPVHWAWYRRQRLDPSVLLDHFKAIPPEKNHILAVWKASGIEADHAFHSQALIQLTNKYCKFKRCLSCYAGNQIISRPGKKG